MERLTAFVQEHIADDTSRLILNRSRWPEIDMDLAVNCIESRRKLRGKVQEWAEPTPERDLFISMAIRAPPVIRN